MGKEERSLLHHKPTVVEARALRKLEAAPTERENVLLFQQTVDENNFTYISYPKNVN